tara:strand:- start:27 stop:929 length:903 start_codon:yes stop_codon:yes gene_type:complete
MAKKGNIPWNKGKTKDTDSRIKKQSETQTGVPKSDSHKANLSKAAKGRPGPTKGIPKTKTQRMKQSKSMKGKPAWNKGKTKENDPILKKMSLTLSKTRKEGFRTGKIKSHRKGSHHTSEAKEKNRQKHLGKVHTDKAKKNMSIAQNKPETLQKNRIRGALQKPKKGPTTPEKLMQNMLEILQIKFHSQHPIEDPPCRPDFFINPNICIFTDGDFDHANPNSFVIPSRTSTIQSGFKANKIIRNVSKSRKKPLFADDVRKRDKKITKELKENGYIPLRFWWSELETESDKCIQKILKAIKA